MNTKEMIAVMQAYEDGKQIEGRPKGATYWHDCPLEPVWSWDDTEYRIKPTSIPVDLSVLIDSGVRYEQEVNDG